MVALNNQNPLDSFRSYSYHFFITVSTSSYDLQQLVGGLDVPSRLDSILSAYPGDRIELGQNTDTYLLLDTRRFSMFNVSHLEMTHVFTASTPERINNPSTPAGTFNMTIKDATGFSLFNLLWQITQKKLLASLESTFYVMGITFNGHKDDGTTEEIATTFIPFTLLDIKFNFGAAESTYNLQCAEIDGGGLGKQSSYMQNLFPVSSVSTKNRSNTLGGLINDLEERLNRASSDFYVKSKTLNEVKGKLVQYMVTIPDEWADFVPSRAYKDLNAEQIYTKIPNTKISSSDKTRVHTVNLDNKTENISDAIKKIIEACPDFLKLTSDTAKKEGNGRLFRIVTNITASDSVFTIHFDVYPVSIPKKQEDGTYTTKKEQLKNLMEFDYIFTGKNKDILDLEINFDNVALAALDSSLNIGQPRFNAASASGQKQSTVNNEGSASIKVNNLRNSKFKENDPLIMPPHDKIVGNNASQIKNAHVDTQTAIKDMEEKREYEQTLAYFHFISNLNVQMKIRGNPLLIKKLADANVKGLAPTPSLDKKDLDRLTAATDNAVSSIKSAQNNTFTELARVLTSSKDIYKKSYYNIRKESISSNYPDPATNNLYATVNIMAPNIDTIGTFFKDKNANEKDKLEPYYTNGFFYDGLYLILNVTTSLSNGQFEHTFQMAAIDTARIYKS